MIYFVVIFCVNWTSCLTAADLPPWSEQAKAVLIGVCKQINEMAQKGCFSEDDLKEKSVAILRKRFLFSGEQSDDRGCFPEKTINKLAEMSVDKNNVFASILYTSHLSKS